MNPFALVTFILVVLLGVANALLVGPSKPPSGWVSSTHRRPSATALHMTLLTYNGQKKDFKAGTPLKNACAALGVKPKYSCKKGECASCTISVGGQRIKACVGKVPPEPKLKSLQEKGFEIR